MRWRTAVMAVMAAIGGLAAGLVIGRAAAPRGLDVRTGDLDLLLAHFWDEADGNPDRGHWQLPLLREAAGRLQLASWLSSAPSAMKLAALAPRPVPDQEEA